MFIIIIISVKIVTSYIDSSIKRTKHDGTLTTLREKRRSSAWWVRDAESVLMASGSRTSLPKDQIYDLKSSAYERCRLVTRTCSWLLTYNLCKV